VATALPLLPWPLAAILAGLAAAGVGWLLTAGVAALAWFSAIVVPLPQVISFASGFWLLSHGGTLDVAGSPVSLAPLGWSLLGLVLARGAGRLAGGQAHLARPGERARAAQARLATAVAGLVALGYAAAVLVAGLAVGARAAAAVPTAGALLLALAGALPGACRGLGTRLTRLLPAPVDAALRGTAAGLWTVFAVAAVALALAVLGGAERITTLEHALRLDTTGAIAFGALTLAYLPNALVWTASWALGGGFGVGGDSVVTLAGSHLGMLPAIPLFGALPQQAVAPAAMLGWLASGVLAGALAGLVAVRWLGRAASWPVVAATALGTGLLLTAVVLAVAWASAGGLGDLRLAHLGPRLADLAWAAGPTLVLAALAAGIVFRAVMGRADVGRARRRGRSSLG
jgi:hypothetical protein